MAPVPGGRVSEVPETRYARNGEIALAYQVIGDGPFDLAYLPAFISNLEIVWEHPPSARFLNRLASFSRLILMDRRGTGLSDRLSPQDLPPLEVLADDLRTVLDDVGSRRCALFGFSDAGTVCAMFAATYPERVTGLVLFACAAVGVATEDFPWQWSEPDWEAYFAELRSEWGTSAYAEKVIPGFFPSHADDAATKVWWGA